MSAFAVGPDAALLLLLAGFLLICLECNRPGWVVPGCVGCAMVLFAFHTLGDLLTQPVTWQILLMGVALLVLGIVRSKANVMAALGTVFLIAGLARLGSRNGPTHVHAMTALLVGAGLGTVSVSLGRIALRARRNKLAVRGVRPAVSAVTG